MKRLLPILVLFVSPLAAQVPVTVNGTITDSSGSPVTAGYVQFDIQPSASALHYFVAGVGTITPQSSQCGIDGSGLLKNAALSGPCLVWGNDAITPANTTYRITFAPNGLVENVVNGECIFSPGPYSLNNPVFCPVVQVNPQQGVIRANPYGTNIMPQANSVFTLGGPNLQWGAVYANNFFLNGVALVPTAFNLSTNNTWTGIQTFSAGTLQLLPGPLTFVSTCGAPCTWTFQNSSDTVLGRLTTDSVQNKTLDETVNTLRTTVNIAGHYLRNNGTKYTDAVVAASDLPAASGSPCAASRWVSAISLGFVLTCTQPAASDLSNGTTGSGAVVLQTTPTITTPVINGASTGTGVQGTDSKLLTSGTISGVGANVCTDANGGITTSGCANVLKVSTGKLGGTSCTTGASTYDQCTSDVTIAPTMPDTSYYANCQGVSASNPRAVVTVVGIISTSVVRCTVTTEGSVAVNFGDLYVIAVHP